MGEEADYAREQEGLEELSTELDTPVNAAIRTWTPEELERMNRLCPFDEVYITDEQFDEAYREMTSWVHGPKRDGSTFRNYTGRMAHKECVERAAAGIAPDQKSLFDAD
jgi:hypothetical protein